MAGLDREQIEALKKQIEEDYRLDMAAIERLQRRFMTSGAAAPGSSLPTRFSSAPPAPREEVPMYEPTLPPPPPMPAYESAPTQTFEPMPSPQQADELHSSLRSIFSSQRNR